MLDRSIDVIRASPELFLTGEAWCCSNQGIHCTVPTVQFVWSRKPTSSEKT